MSALIIPVVACFGAEYAARNLLPDTVTSWLFAHTHSHLSLSLPRAFAAVIVLNIVWSAITMIMLAVKVGTARKSFKERAAKDGDTDAEARFSYPKLYAEGFSVHAKQFNNIQRGHQQALETYGQFLILSVLGGLSAPVATALAGALWNVARMSWAQGYAVDSAKRYDWLGKHIWSSLLVLLGAALFTAVQLLRN